MPETTAERAETHAAAAPAEPATTPAPLTTVTPSASPTPNVATRERLDELRIQFGSTINRYFLTLFIVTIIIALVLVALITIGFFLGKTMEATVLAASVQVAFGMVLGFVCVYIGLMMTWAGIDAAYSVRGDVGGGAVALKSASPGLLFALGGMVLVAVSLYKRIEYQENGMNLVDTQTLAPGARRGATTPNPPKTIKLPSSGSGPSEPAVGAPATIQP